MKKIKPDRNERLKWYDAKGNTTYRINYKLNDSSVVVDVGARTGEWADLIRDKYKCEVHCFECLPDFCLTLYEKGYRVYAYAVWDKDDVIDIGFENDQASVYCDPRKAHVSTQVIEASRIFELIKFDHIDLLKLNVEGAEYGILDNLIYTGNITKIDNIQVQFHLYEVGMEGMYYELANRLKKTHYTTYKFPFIWENWRIK